MSCTKEEEKYRSTYYIYQHVVSLFRTMVSVVQKIWISKIITMGQCYVKKTWFLLNILISCFTVLTDKSVFGPMLERVDSTSITL